MSRSQQIVGGAVVWAIAVLATAFIPPYFFGFTADSELTVPVVIVYVVGYLIQLAAIFLVNHAYGHSRIWPFFVASGLPWIADAWVAMGGPTIIAVVVLVAVLAWLFAALPLRQIWLEENGLPVEATIVRVEPGWFNFVINNIYVQRKVVLNVPTSGGKSIQRSMNLIFEIGSYPTPGAVVPLRVDPHNPRRFIIDSRKPAA